MVQTCIVHLIRAAPVDVVSGPQSCPTCATGDLHGRKRGHRCARLDAFGVSELGRKYPKSVKVWRDAWDRLVLFLQFPPAVRRVLYTANSIASLNAKLLKATRSRGNSHNDPAVLKTLWLMICTIEVKRVVQRVKKAKHDIEYNG